jgi:hypothetical protein
MEVMLPEGLAVIIAAGGLACEREAASGYFSTRISTGWSDG